MLPSRRSAAGSLSSCSSATARCRRAGSLLLTNLSAEQLVGTNGQTWAIGMSPMAFEVMAATALIVLALFAAPRYLKSGITTFWM